MRCLDDLAILKQKIRRAKKQCHLLAMQFHSGEQYQARANERQRTVGHAAIDAGADVVIGHHPHWIQDIEFYKGKFIAYSLGNFVFDMDHRPKVREGLLLKCLFKGTTLHQVELHPVFIQGGAPKPVPAKDPSLRSRDEVLRELFRDSGWET